MGFCSCLRRTSRQSGSGPLNASVSTPPEKPLLRAHRKAGSAARSARTDAESRGRTTSGT